jgi:cobalt transporter subunit CbtB
MHTHPPLSTLAQQPLIAAPSLAKRLLPALSAALLGIVILFAVGFAQGPNAAAHEVAHDTRHAMGFPCH